MGNNTIYPISESDDYGWGEDKDRLILYADFMGFKSLVDNKEHKDLKQELETFRFKLDERLHIFCHDENLRYAQFSDSILIVVNGIDESMFKLLTKATVCLMHVAMQLKFPLKGVIAQGIFTYDKDRELYLGKPLVDAYLLHDQIKYYGIVVHNSAEKTIKEFRSCDFPYLKSKINIERGIVRHFHLCWNLLNLNLSNCDITAKCLEWLDVISEQVSGNPRIYVDNTIRILEEDKNDTESRKILETNRNAENQEVSAT